MATGDGSTVLALPASVTTGRESSTFTDLREHVDPDGVWIPGPDRVPRAAARVRQFFDVPVVHPPLGATGGPVQRHDFGRVSIVTVQRASALSEAVPEITACTTSDTVESDGPNEVVLVCDDVGTTIDRTTLEASLDHAAALVDCVPDYRTTLTVLSGRLPAAYDRYWGIDRESGAVIGVFEPGERPCRNGSSADVSRAWLRVCGIGPVDGYSDAGTVVTLELTPDRADEPDREADRDTGARPIRSIESVAADAFGIRAVDGVGAKTAAKLAERGVSSRRDLLELSAPELASLPGIGSKRARRMRQHARVLETGNARRLSTESLPACNDAEPPLCLDIETDGLSPTILWQVGVYDPATDEYHAFVERTDPSDPGRVLESFLKWLLGGFPDRTLLTWNGWRFDYRHLEAFVGRYVPQYATEWRSVPKRDLYRWAVTDGNASLPGRTNALDDVAAALGYDGANTGLDGAATATAYSRFIRTGDPLEWDRHERYCEDDCRALWAVYEHLAEAPIAEDKPEPTTAGQTGLGEF